MHSDTERVDMVAGTLGTVIQTRRRLLGLSQEELARRAQLHRTYISEIERRARNLSVKILVQIALALDTTASELMAEAEKLLAAQI
jgi:transcriptional regulator with XRE-family HTH domain